MPNVSFGGEVKEENENRNSTISDARSTGGMVLPLHCASN
jgi:hypothetical protein